MPLEGAQRGAPLTVQVADRRHLLHNLSGAVQRAVSRHRAHLRELATPEVAAPLALPEPARDQGARQPAPERGTPRSTRPSPKG
ncbi:hypothetical protein AB0O34_12835 [Sphaerisporangium sp. NPDC088356]|uniref:hypothetical protein n=1 Tax=Sphaerisporangium sp. NPDC088356 TaxID=3154871 RepID=UPI00343BDD53